MTFAFDLATAVIHARDGVYQGAVHDGWDIRGNANGGYVMALLASAMRSAANRPDPISLTLHYLAPLPPGDFEIHTQVVKQGRRFTTVSASMIFGGREAVRAIGAFGEAPAVGSGLQHHGTALSDVPSFEECARRMPEGENIPLALMSKLDVRLHPYDRGFAIGQPSGVPIVRGWFAFADARPNDTLSVLLAADAFPPPVFNLLTVPGWVPTVEFTVHIRAVPAPGPLRCEFTAKEIQGGVFEEDGIMWDENGVLVAQSRQIGLIPL